jgi:putative aldouronate transport system permease protein
MNVSFNRRTGLSNWIILLVVLLIALTCLLPLMYIISLSLSGKTAAMAGKVTLFPVDFTLNSYQYLLKDQQFYASFIVSLKRVFLGGMINFILTVLMAYPLSKEVDEFKGRNIYMWVVVFTMMFTGGLIPWYMLIKSLNLLDTIWALVLPGAVPVFNVILLMNFFRGLPKEIHEAAEMDGAGPWRSLLAVVIPLSLPALATVTLFSVVGHWNAFFDGLILIHRQENIPLQTYIQQLVVKPITSSTIAVDELSKMDQRTFNAAKIVITMLPVMIVYPFLQKYFISGITLGSIKG